CPALVEPPSTRCPQHQLAQDREITARRGSAAARGYTSVWRTARAAYLATHPWCEPHLAKGERVRAVLVDHHVPLRSGGPRLDPSNFTSMCRRCHGSKTWRDRKAGRRGGFPSCHPPRGDPTGLVLAAVWPRDK